MNREEFSARINSYGRYREMIGYSKSANETRNHREAADKAYEPLMAEFDRLELVAGEAVELLRRLSTAAQEASNGHSRPITDYAGDIAAFLAKVQP